MEQDVRIKNGDETEFLGIAGGNYRLIISGEETDGAYAVFEMIVPPNGGPPPHSHPDFREMFYVLEGEFEFKTTSGKQTVSPGGLVNIPLGGAIHCFKNISGDFSRLLCTVIPAGLENYFKELGQVVRQGEFLPLPEMTPERMKLISAADEKYNQKTYPRDYLDQ